MPKSESSKTLRLFPHHQRYQHDTTTSPCLLDYENQEDVKNLESTTQQPRRNATKAKNEHELSSNPKPSQTKQS